MTRTCQEIHPAILYPNSVSTLCASNTFGSASTAPISITTASTTSCCPNSDNSLNNSAAYYSTCTRCGTSAVAFSQRSCITTTTIQRTIAGHGEECKCC